MQRFARLFCELDRSTATLDKRAALVDYFREAPAGDAVWALWLLSGGKLGRIASTRELREWISEESGLPDWLVEDSYDQVGDLGETLALLLDDPPEAAPDVPLHAWIEQRLLPVDRFGPVRAVEPVQVFELAFEAVNLSARHKSGVAVRFPRILRWRHDKPAAEADRLDTLRSLAR